MNMNETYSGPMANPKVQQAVRKALDYTGIQTICGEGTLTPYDIRQGWVSVSLTAPRAMTSPSFRISTASLPPSSPG